MIPEVEVHLRVKEGFKIDSNVHDIIFRLSLTSTHFKSNHFIDGFLWNILSESIGHVVRVGHPQVRVLGQGVVALTTTTAHVESTNFFDSEGPENERSRLER